MKLTANLTKTMRRFLGALLLVVALAFVTTPQAKADEFSFSLDIPLQFAFTGDLQGTARPSGFIAALNLPIHIGVGVEAFSVEADDPSSTLDVTIDYEFTDFYVWWNFQVMTVSFGGGTGSAKVKEYTDSSGALVSTDEADADQVFLVLGWMLNMDWEFHVSYHQIDAEANNLVAGVADGTTTDLGGVMTSAGFRFTF